MHIKVKRFSLTLLQTQNAATNFQSLSPCHLDISQVKNACYYTSPIGKLLPFWTLLAHNFRPWAR